MNTAVVAQRIKDLLLTVACSAVATILSTISDGRSIARYADIMGCESGCDVAAAGWPGPFVIDYPGLSPTGSAGLLGLLIGSDKFNSAAFVLSWSFWLALSFLMLFLVRLRRAARP